MNRRARMALWFLGMSLVSFSAMMATLAPPVGVAATSLLTVAAIMVSIGTVIAWAKASVLKAESGSRTVSVGAPRESALGWITVSGNGIAVLVLWWVLLRFVAVVLATSVAAGWHLHHTRPTANPVPTQSWEGLALLGAVVLYAGGLTLWLATRGLRYRRDRKEPEKGMSTFRPETGKGRQKRG